MKYANIIVAISVEKLDKTFKYSIPENLQKEMIEFQNCLFYKQNMYKEVKYE